MLRSKIKKESWIKLTFKTHINWLSHGENFEKFATFALASCNPNQFSNSNYSPPFYSKKSAFFPPQNFGYFEPTETPTVQTTLWQSFVATRTGSNSCLRWVSRGTRKGRHPGAAAAPVALHVLSLGIRQSLSSSTSAQEFCAPEGRHSIAHSPRTVTFNWPPPWAWGRPSLERQTTRRPPLPPIE